MGKSGREGKVESGEWRVRYDTANVPHSPLSTHPSSLTIVVTHYRTPEILWECLRRLELYAKDTVKIVVDADSQDGTLEELVKRFSEVRGVWTENHSLANAVNTGLKLAKTPYILQINADVYIEEDTVSAMLERLRNPKVGMVGPRCKDKTGKWQNQGLPYRRYYQYLTLTKAKFVSVSWVHGCCQMLRRDVLEKVGGMNTSYRFYNEDIEWSWRIRKAGYRCELLSNVVTHLGGSSTPKNPLFLVEGYRGGFVLSQCYKSALYQKFHRAVVIAEAGYQSRFSKDDVKRQAYKTIKTMVRSNKFNESPFGETLASANSQFTK
jgi:N-acetylglucosaminyl-diphospho-decaprenol L-rhamnosyltransferase